MEQKSHWSANIVYLLAWLICSILLIVGLLVVREATISIMRAIQVRQVAASAAGEAGKTLLDTGFTMRAIDTSIIFVGAIVAAGLAIGIEVYFRRGKEQGKLWQRIGLVLGIEVGVILICLIILNVV
jgi:hypothetical protein